MTNKLQRAVFKPKTGRQQKRRGSIASLVFFSFYGASWAAKRWIEPKVSHLSTSMMFLSLARLPQNVAEANALIAIERDWS